MSILFVFMIFVFIYYIPISVLSILVSCISGLYFLGNIKELANIIIDLSRMDLIVEKLIFINAQETKFDVLFHRKYYEIRFINRKKIMKTTEVINLKPDTPMNITYLRRSNILINTSLNE